MRICPCQRILGRIIQYIHVVGTDYCSLWVGAISKEGRQFLEFRGVTPAQAWFLEEEAEAALVTQECADVHCSHLTMLAI